MTATRLGFLLLALSTVQLAPVALAPAHAAKHKKAKREAASGPQRAIRQEGQLAPKKEYGVDQSVSKTKDLRPVGEAEKRPGISGRELDQTQAEAMMGEKLDEEIKLAQDLLEYETGCEEVSPVRFRLADMFWEKSKREFFKANDSSLAEADRAAHSAEMKRLQEEALNYYQKITDDCPNYTEIPKILFYYGRALTELDRAKDGATYFKQIIKDYPTSEWVAQAWFMIGEYYFNSANDALAALKAYTKATEYPTSPSYPFAVYKQGWCFINVAEWQQALDKFEAVIKISDDSKQAIDAKQRTSLRKEAIKDFVRAFANIGTPQQALAKFRSVGNAKEVPQMLESLGNWYINQGAHANVVVIYRDLIKSYPNSIRLPVFQGRVVDAVSRLGSPKDTVKEAKLLTDYFLAVRARAEKGALSTDEQGTIKKDMAEAEDIAENTIRRLATEYHKDAKKLRGPAQDRQYAFALDLYKSYLAVFNKPKEGADVNYVFFMRFYYAEVLFKVEHFLEAAQNYDQVVEMNPRPTDPKEKEIVLAAAEEAVRSYDELVQDLDRKNPPDISGTVAKPIPEVKEKLIAACKRYIDYVGSEGDKIVEIRYKMARIYYSYNHFEQAAPAFNDIVQNHPETAVACYSANLALDIYNGQKNYRALKDASRSYLDNKRLACGEQDRARFSKIEEQSSFHLIKNEFEEKKRYLAAGNAYMQFYKDYPQSEFADDAVYNAAVNYDLGNRLDKANEVRRFLVDKLPNSPLVPETLYNIAQSYERIVDFANAAKYLEMFAKRYPKDPRSKDAIYNSALYLGTLHDFAGANEGRENYIRLYPGAEDVHNVAFSICESMELEAQLMEKQAKEEHKLHELDRPIAKKWTDAHDCYFNYIKEKKYAGDTDLVCHAQFRRGEIMRFKTKYDAGADEIRKVLNKMWPTWKKAGVAKVPRCAAAMAELQFRDLQWFYKKYAELTISELNPSKKGKKAFDASIKTKITERDKLVTQYKSVAELGVAQWALAALYGIGECYRDSIDKLLNAPVPDRVEGYKLSAEDKGLLRQQLREMAAPIEDSAVEAYRLCVDKANELGLYNKWSVRSLDQLQKLRPQEYPLVVERQVPVSFIQALVVQRNGVIIADGEDLKPVQVKFKEEPPPKENEPKAAPGAAAKSPAAPAPTPPPAPPPEAKKPDSDVPAPVEDK